MDLGDSSAARKPFTLALAQRDESSTRDRSIWYNRLGVACLKDRDLEAALDAGHKALDLIAIAPSSRSTDHVNSFRRELRPFRREKAVREYENVVREILRY